MKRFAFVVGLVALGLVAAAPASADFAVVKFGSGYCRVWNNTHWGPEDGRFLWFHRHHHHWVRHFRTWDRANMALHRATHWHRCRHWWW